MSKRRLRRKSCEGKRRYATKQEAESAAWEAAVRLGEWLHPYACRFCGRFHIGHPTKKARQGYAGRARLRRETA
jgi:hypothetical protein